MDNRKANIILGLIATLFGIVSIFTLFATAFGASDTPGHASTLGSCFDVMFGSNERNLLPVPLLITAFMFQVVAIPVLLIGAIIPGRIGSFGLALGAILLAVAGVFWLTSPTFFLAINKMEPSAENVVLGTGAIITAVFAFVSGLLGLYNAYRNFKA